MISIYLYANIRQLHHKSAENHSFSALLLCNRTLVA